MTPTLTHGRTMTLLFSIENQRIADIVYLLVKNEIVEVLRPDKLSEAEHLMALRFLQLSS